MEDVKMYLLVACAASWLVLLGSFVTAWTQLPQPRTTSDLVVIIVIGAATAAFSRIGLVSLISLLLRVLPSGRVRSVLAGFAIRAMPRVLASSVLAVVSATVAVQVADAAPAHTVQTGWGVQSIGAEVAAAAPADPGWPTIGEEPSEGPGATDSKDGLHDPGWPTKPPEKSPSEADRPESDGPGGPHDEDNDDDGSSSPDDSDDDRSHAAPRTSTHEVIEGESLWSIAAEFVDDPEEIPQRVNDIYTDNRETIGPDPSLIIAGQRLEIQP
jgi:hypothetical protein